MVRPISRGFSAMKWSSKYIETVKTTVKVYGPVVWKTTVDLAALAASVVQLVEASARLRDIL
jgi:hypothetical protein